MGIWEEIIEVLDILTLAKKFGSGFEFDMNFKSDGHLSGHGRTICIQKTVRTVTNRAAITR